MRALKKMAPVVAKISALEAEISALTDEQLAAKTKEFRAAYDAAVGQHKTQMDQLETQLRAALADAEKEAINTQLTAVYEEFKRVKTETLSEILPAAFAVVREASKRVIGLRHFDVQMIGGMALHQGCISEMTTGEGKTLVATLPAYLNGMTGEGVHVVTVNDYLAKRDREWMGPIFEFLGLRVGVIQHDLMPAERQAAYGCDITYGTNNEFGFDYLRDNMVTYREDMVQRRHHFAIVDEVDSILVDEARTPLIISGPAEESTDKYYRANEIAKKLKGRRITEKEEVDAKYKNIDLAAGFDYMADEKSKSISLTEVGEQKAAKLFGVDNLHDMETIEYRHHILQAVRAREFFHIDVDYVAREGEVIIVDEFTGRLMPGRRWSDGLHQAVEAKEGIKIERENQTLATITLQNYFRLYEKLAGMTGTAYTEATEFKSIYGLDVITIPTNKPLLRKNLPDAIYRSQREKFNAVVEEIAACHKNGQPVLVGTISIEKSERVANLLKQRGIPHQVLNAKFHEQEANIIAQAGRFAGVTIATNMAGRGTDIVLGGNPDYLAKNLAAQKFTEKQTAEEQAAVVTQFLEEFRVKCKEEQKKVLERGGLYVIGTERHESRRIDNQLRGRQGRQGDPGASKFYVSLEDDLMRLFASDKIIGLMDKLGMEEGQVLEHPWLSGAIETAQKRVESHNFEIRKHLLEYDDVMNRQREVVYDMRRSILEQENVKPLVMDAVTETVSLALAQYTQAEGQAGGWDVDGLDIYLRGKFGYSIEDVKEQIRAMSAEDLKEKIFNHLTMMYEAKEKEIDPVPLRHLERMVFLHTIDSKWKDHLYAMDQLKEGIGLRSFAQRDPLIEFKKEGFAMFQDMHGSLKEEVAEVMFKLQPRREGAPAQMRSVFSGIPQQTIHNEIGGMSEVARQSAPVNPDGSAAPEAETAPQPFRHEGPKVGRNDQCPCGSGKKYKKCCGR
ncbi:MAG: preprotein translocase subunit SecA [Candidatus Omnitrophica bacterium]|nr:preprotein translocase subunit SecA [Candidatus Omnitrophota bacterium]